MVVITQFLCNFFNFWVNGEVEVIELSLNSCLMFTSDSSLHYFWTVKSLKINECQLYIIYFSTKLNN